MIKRTFYNLPEAKREKIIEVTRKEFRKGNKRKITINSVIKNAGISRGSFYQYFDDKLDLVELCFDDVISRIVDFIRDELMLNGGDIFEVPERIFDVMISEKRDYTDIVSLTDSANLNNSLISDYLRYRSRDMHVLDGFGDLIDRSGLALDSDEDIECVIVMMFDAIKAAVFNVTKAGKSAESERRILCRKIEILRNGAYAKS